MRQFATQGCQKEKEKMLEWKETVMQEVARKLHIIRQMYEGVMEAQKQGFYIEFERVRGKLEQARVKIEIVGKQSKSFEVSGTAHDPENSTRQSCFAPSSSGNQDQREKRQTEDLRDQEESPEHQQIETNVTKASTPSQPPANPVSNFMKKVVLK